MTKLLSKLRSTRGESMTETLVSIAIFAMSISLMATMVAVAFKMTLNAKEQDVKFNEELSAAEVGTEVISGNHHITITDGATAVDVDVTLYGSEDGSLRSYAYNP